MPFTLLELRDVLLLQSHNTRLVVCATMLLGVAGGLAGGFMLLRKRALFGDVLSHATLPGIALAFVAGSLWWGGGKQLGLLLAGATLSGLAGVAVMILIRKFTRLHEDVAMGFVLSVFFGTGTALLRMAQSLPDAAGLESFIYGKTASMVAADLQLIAIITVGVVVICLVLFKEFTLICFDEAYAATTGWPVRFIDVILLVLLTIVTVAGIQSVGLILVIAYLVIPAAAARFWTDKLGVMLILAALFGALSGWLGASLSALLDGFPAGAIIVLSASACFLLSMFCGSARGMLPRWFAARHLKRRMDRQHFLRAAYEVLDVENGASVNQPIRRDVLMAHRSWSSREFARLLRIARRQDHVESTPDLATIRLSESGFGEAARITRNHRLWELYLIRHADIAPCHVDRDADMVEHILGADLVHSLEAEMDIGRGIPTNPHRIPKS
jgi:manganese/zinc/iron transport system permease protein